MKKTSNKLTGPLVAALVYDGLCTFEFSIVSEIFGLERPEMGADWYRFISVAVEPGPLRAHGGLTIQVEHQLSALRQADIIFVPGWKGPHAAVTPALVRALLTAAKRGARLASICSGVFVLAATGLLHHKRAATHWRYADALQQAYPEIEVDAQVLYVENDQIFTSAGSAAGIDLSLHIIRSDYGAEAANSVARRLVVPPQRAGGQSQFIDRPVPAVAHHDAANRIAPLLDNIRSSLDRKWTVSEMAAHAAMSARTFLRRFTETVGEPPALWLQRERLREAKRLLEATALDLDRVAEHSGIGSPATMRRLFAEYVGVSPNAYRMQFKR
jgi:AraC family transcriptional regulator, transcriptional activator FtrA